MSEPEEITIPQPENGKRTTMDTLLGASEKDRVYPKHDAEKAKVLRKRPEGKAMVTTKGELTGLGQLVYEVQTIMGGEIVGNIEKPVAEFDRQVKEARVIVDTLWQEADVDSQIPTPDPDNPLNLSGRYLNKAVELIEPLGDQESGPDADTVRKVEAAINEVLAITQKPGAGVATYMGEVVMREREGFLDLTKNIAAAALVLESKVDDTRASLREPEDPYSEPTVDMKGAAGMLWSLKQGQYDPESTKSLNETAKRYPDGVKKSADLLVSGLASIQWLRGRVDSFANSVVPTSKEAADQLANHAQQSLRQSVSRVDRSGVTFALANNGNELAFVTNGLIRNQLPRE